jgi:hypothetical protein
MTSWRTGVTLRWSSPYTFALAFSLLILGSLPKQAMAGDFMDTRITFGMADNNLLLGPGQSNPNSPSPNFLPGQQNTLFFDNYNTRFSGFETLSHAVLYKEMPSFFKGLTTAAALVVRLQYRENNSRTAEFQLRDSGSYIFMEYDLGGSKTLKRNISFTAFPLSSDRFRMGYSFRISWGGDRTFPRRTVISPVPGGKLQLTYDFNKDTRFFIFAGAKTSLLQKRITPELIEEETAAGVLSGLGLRIGGFQIEGGAAFFDKGTFSNPGVRGEPVQFYGFTGQMSYSYGIPIGVSIDFQLYRNDPNTPFRFFRPETYTPGKFSFAISSEFSYVVNMLQDADTLTGIIPAPGMAGDLNFRMKYGYFRMHADIVFRDLGFILQEVPGFVPFQSFTADQIKQSISPEFFIAVGADYYIKDARLTVGLKAGVLFPAYFKGFLPPEVTGNNAPNSLETDQIVVIRNEGDFTLLPPKDSAGNAVTVLPVISAKLNFKWQLSPFLAAVGELLFSLDNNQTRLQRSVEDGTVEERVFIDPIILGFNLMLQARF